MKTNFKQLSFGFGRRYLAQVLKFKVYVSQCIQGQTHAPVLKYSGPRKKKKRQRKRGLEFRMSHVSEKAFSSVCGNICDQSYICVSSV